VPITTADHRLVWYAREREGSNYFGQSLFRASYGPWLIKDQMLRVHATSIRRSGWASPAWRRCRARTPQQIAEAQRSLATSRRPSDSPASRVPPGFTGSR
jgi:hypothetical protein